MKKIERICKNCKLYNPDEKMCSVVVLYEGEKVSLKMEPNEKCFFEQEYFDPHLNLTDSFANEIKEIKVWVEDENGNKTDGEGTVKMEIPND